MSADHILVMDLINPNTSISLILPELLVALAGVVVMVYDSFFPRQRGVTGTISLAGLAASAIVLGSMWGSLAPAGAWNGMIAHDNLRLSFSFVFLFVTAITILVSTVWEDNENVPAGEYHALLMFGTFGMMLMASGNDLVVIFLGLETLSISTYVMAGLRRGDLKSNESAMKYFILGSFASAFLLYGMALTYGATGSTNITEIAAKIAGANFPALLLVGGAMMIVGFGFKAATGSVPCLDAGRLRRRPDRGYRFYVRGAKGGGVCFFHSCFCSRLSARCRCPGFGLSAPIVDDGPYRDGDIVDDVGNVAAILQNNVKRMLAYSSIAHAGYAMVGFIGAGAAKTAAARDEAIASVAFYMLTYAVTNLGAFAIVALLAKRTTEGPNSTTTTASGSARRYFRSRCLCLC